MAAASKPHTQRYVTWPDRRCSKAAGHRYLEYRVSPTGSAGRMLAGNVSGRRRGHRSPAHACSSLSPRSQPGRVRGPLGRRSSGVVGGRTCPGAADERHCEPSAVTASGRDRPRRPIRYAREHRQLSPGMPRSRHNADDGGTPEKVPDNYRAASPGALLPLGVPHVLIWGEREDFMPRPLAAAYVKRAQA